MTKFLLAVAIAYLGWRFWYYGPHLTRKPKPQPMAGEPPERREARAVLGLGADPTEAEIRAAHRRLVAAVHPDRGGSPELARQINAARDTLLREGRDTPPSPTAGA